MAKPSPIDPARAKTLLAKGREYFTQSLPEGRPAYAAMVRDGINALLNAADARCTDAETCFVLGRLLDNEEIESRKDKDFPKAEKLITYRAR